MRKPLFEPVTFSECDGVRYLHLGTPWVQGAMNIRNPNKLELEYAQQMMAWLLFLEPGKDFKTLQLGLGTGALTKFSHRLNKHIHAHAVEINPGIVIAATSMFQLKVVDERMKIYEEDALDFVQNPEHFSAYDTVQVDIFNGDAAGPALNSYAFYQGIFNTLKAPGIMTVNLFNRHESFQTNIDRICDVFDNRVLLFNEVHDCNVVAIAFKGPPLKVSWKDLDRRAKDIRRDYKIQSKKWVKNLRKANLQPTKHLEI